MDQTRENALLLDVQDLKTHFFTSRGTVKAVDGVSFRLGRGQTLALVGESGSGKTITCLSLLRLVAEPQGRIVEGKILYKCVDLLTKKAREMREIRGGEIAMIFQDPTSSLDPVFTIGSQVGEAVQIHQHLTGKPLVAKVTEALSLVRIPSPELRQRNYPHELSGGMKQRVQGAIALSCQPSLIIADEPTTSLDVTTQAHYLDLLKRLQEELGFAMIFVTHNLGIVARVADRVAVMYQGRIVENAGITEIFTRPAHRYTSLLLQSIPNLDAKVDKLISIRGEPPNPYNVPTGCHFSPRCDKATDICFQDYPPTTQVGVDHFVNCWHAEK